MGTRGGRRDFLVTAGVGAAGFAAPADGGAGQADAGRGEELYAKYLDRAYTTSI